ncbi:MAG: helix-hairpin-helix domain-containing protein [Bacteroidales bacterium]|jgi:DNA uptake protein ComE-like DNA-binding protein|nr:helix-hairpin-helix domain-containing protein [Bacteroidales bacterium]
MLSFFRFSRGEWTAAILISIVLFFTLILKNIYPKRHTPAPLSAHYEQEISRFVERQQHLADSLKQLYAAKKERRYFPEYDSTKPRRYISGLILDDSVKRKPKVSGYAIVKVELNRCDTSDITRIPLFGVKRAEKIVEYRERLGGFHHLEQLHDIFVIQNIAMEHIEKYFTVNPNEINKIKINEVEYANLVRHPYFDSYLAKTVLQYRQKNGKIKDMEHFREITHAYEELVGKLRPYLEFGE